MDNKNKYLILTGGILFISIAYFFIEKNLKEIKIDIDKNTVYSIGKVYYINSKRSFTDARFFYFYNGNKYESGKYIDNSGDEYLNKYFKIEFSSKNPQHSNIFFNQEVLEKEQIKNAGFDYEKK